MSEGVGGLNVADELLEQAFVDARAALAALNAVAGLGDTVALVGTNAEATAIDPTAGSLFELVSTSDGGVNDFDLGDAAFDGQEITIYFKTKNTVNVTVTEGAGVTILAWAGTAVASLTLDAADEFVRLKSIRGTWYIMQTTATVA